MSEYELSTRLFALRRKLAEHHSGVVLTADEVRALTGEIKTLGIIAQRDEHELRRLRASTGALALRQQASIEAAVLAAAREPGTNVRLLAFERPFSDGAPL